MSYSWRCSENHEMPRMESRPAAYKAKILPSVLLFWPNFLSLALPLSCNLPCILVVLATFSWGWVLLGHIHLVFRGCSWLFAQESLTPDKHREPYGTSGTACKANASPLCGCSGPFLHKFDEFYHGCKRPGNSSFPGITNIFALLPRESHADTSLPARLGMRSRETVAPPG